MSRGILCPVVVEDCDIPLEFQDIQAAHIIDFDFPSESLNRLISKVQLCCGKPQASAPSAISAIESEPKAVHQYDHYIRSLRRVIEICDFVSFLGAQPSSRESETEIHKAFSRLKFEMGQIESTERRVFKRPELFSRTENAKYLIWRAAKNTFPWPVFDSLRRSKLKVDIDEAAYNLSIMYGELRLDVRGDEQASEEDQRNPQWFSGIRLSDEGVREIYKQFALGKTIYAAAKHMGISYRAASLRHETWKRDQGGKTP